MEQVLPQHAYGMGFLGSIAIFLSTSIHWEILQDGAIDKEKGSNFQSGNYRGVQDSAIIIEADVRRRKDLS